MKPHSTLILALFGICVCSCRKEVQETSVVATSLVCSSSDLISLSYELRSLALDKAITLASAYAYLHRDDHSHWKLIDDSSSLDSGGFTYASNDWNGVVIEGSYYLDSHPDPTTSLTGTIYNLDIVLNDVSSAERIVIIAIMKNGAFCW